MKTYYAGGAAPQQEPGGERPRKILQIEGAKLLKGNEPESVLFFFSSHTSSELFGHWAGAFLTVPI